MNAATEMKALLADGSDRYATHEVRNQAGPATGFNAFSGDAVLTAAIAREAPWAQERCVALGALAGDEQVQDAARLANRHTPELKTHDRFGHRIDWVEFHPAWHQLMALAWRHEVHSLAWTARERQPHYARAVLSYLWNQVEHGTGCPTGMAYAAHAGPAQHARTEDLGDQGRDQPVRLQPGGSGAKGGCRHRLRDDGKAGRQRPARDADDGGAFAQRRLPRRARRLVRADRPQVVLLGARRRRLLHAREGRRRRDLLLPAAHAARRQLEPLLHPAPQGQVRQQVQCLQRDRVRRHAGGARRRRRPRHPRDPVARAPDAARLRGRLRRADAPGAHTRARAHVDAPRLCPAARRSSR